MFRAVGAVSAVLALGLVACTSPEDQAAQEIEEINQALEEAEEPEPSYLDLDPATENTIDFNGLEFTLSSFELVVCTWGEEDTTYLGFDITVSIKIGENYVPGLCVYQHSIYGHIETEVLQDENTDDHF